MQIIQKLAYVHLTMKMEAACYSETVISMWYNAVQLKLNAHRDENCEYYMTVVNCTAIQQFKLNIH